MENTLKQNSPSLNAKIDSLLEKRPIILQLFRFVVIGALNTVVDFIILNLLSVALGVNSGARLGLLNIPGVVVAIIQSYLWNKHWAFGSVSGITAFKNFIRLFLVGFLGLVSFGLVLLGVSTNAPVAFYAILLFIFLITQIVLWHYFGLARKQIAPIEHHNEFVVFIIVSLVGVVINSIVISLGSVYIANSGAFTPDLAKNLAKFGATLIALAWNFAGYKLFVFKK